LHPVWLLLAVIRGQDLVQVGSTVSEQAPRPFGPRLSEVNFGEEVQGRAETEHGDRLFLKDKSGAYGEGFESSDGFVVLSGALARRTVTPGMQEYGVTLRESLTKSGVLVADGEYLRLDRDYTFSSPSNASMTLLGRSSNGRLEWANREGTSLKALQERAITRT
jgi:Domain of unknown function (DUF4357)